MTNRQSQFQEDATFRVLRQLEREPDISQRELAERHGLSFSCLNYCVRSLMDKGLVKHENFSKSRHKTGYVHMPTRTELAAKATLTGRFVKCKMPNTRP